MPEQLHRDRATPQLGQAHHLGRGPSEGVGQTAPLRPPLVGGRAAHGEDRARRQRDAGRARGTGVGQRVEGVHARQAPQVLTAAAGPVDQQSDPGGARRPGHHPGDGLGPLVPVLGAVPGRGESGLLGQGPGERARRGGRGAHGHGTRLATKVTGLGVCTTAPPRVSVPRLGETGNDAFLGHATRAVEPGGGGRCPVARWGDVTRAPGIRCPGAPASCAGRPSTHRRWW